MERTIIKLVRLYLTWLPPTCSSCPPMLVPCAFPPSGFVLWYANFFSIVVVSGLAMHALWPMVSLSLGWSIPSFYYIKVTTYPNNPKILLFCVGFDACSRKSEKHVGLDVIASPAG